MERQDTTIIETRNTRASINLKVEYQRLNAFFADYTTNISKGGTFISTNEPLDVGTEFAFKLDIPGVEEVLSLKGIVRWVVSVDDADERGPGMGIEFVYEDDEERARVESVVEELMVSSLGRDLYEKLLGGEGAS